MFITTVAHCGGRSERVSTSWYSWAGPADNLHKFGDAWYLDWDNDTQFMRGSNNLSGRTYDGCVKPGTQLSKPVAGIRGVQYAGMWTYTSGAQTGVECAATLQYRWQERVDGANANVLVWWAYKGDHQVVNTKATAADRCSR